MARTESKREATAASASVARGLRESALWIFGALGLILLVALASYDRADPAFSSTGQPGPVTNLIGPFGAWLSDLFFVLFGAPAFLFPIMLGFAGWALFQERRSQEPIDRRTTAIRGVGLRAGAREQLRPRHAAFLRAARCRTPRAGCSARWSATGSRSR